MSLADESAAFPGRLSRVHSLLTAVLAASFALLVSSPARGDGDEDDIEEYKTEFGFVPLVGGDSDVGFGGGELSSLTGYAPHHRPYAWRLESGTVVTFKPPAGGETWRVPYLDAYLDWVVPEFIDKNVRLEIRPSYTRETTQAYYGIGNASLAPTAGPEGQLAQEYFQYGREHPTLLARLRVALGRGYFFLFGNYITYNQLVIHPDSQLERDLNPGSVAHPFFGPLGPHLVDVFEYGLLYDTRDEETSTHSGAFHQAKLRLSPGGAGAFPYRYGQVDIIARFYVTPVPRWLSLALRLVADAQFGNPPFYELPRYEDTFALGGSNGVRGVPGQRYYGKIKVFGNLEARTELATMKLGSKDYTLGLTGFFDGGRLWADWRRDSTLDGSGVGLKYGVGMGLRFQQGKAFVVRADVAWSPDARPIGAYFTAGQAF